MTNSLENGIAAAKKGDKARARQYIQQAVQENPQNITGWLWLSTLIDEAGQKKYCYQKVLALDPKNEYALKGMTQLGFDVQPAPRVVNEKAPTSNSQPVAPEPQRKKFEYIETIESEYRPSWDIYEPHMPSVDLYSDMEEFFENARILGLKGSAKGFREEFIRKHPEFESRIAWFEPIKEGEKYVPVISPGRIVFLMPAFIPKTQNAAANNPGDVILPSRKNLKITAISYTHMKDFMNGSLPMEERLVDVVKCIPFIGQMAAFTGVQGHSTFIFEGHPSVFETGVKNSDVLFVDSGMLKFLQEDWAEVAFRSMNPHCKIFMHDRQAFKLRAVIRKKDYPGWDYGIGVGNETNYAKMLYTVLASSEIRGKHILLASGKPLPNLSQLTKKPEALEFLSKIPFDYEQLDIQKIIKLIVADSEKKFLSSKRTYSIKYQQTETKKIIDYVFSLKTSEDKNGNLTVDTWLD